MENLRCGHVWVEEGIVGAAEEDEEGVLEGDVCWRLFEEGCDLLVNRRDWDRRARASRALDDRV